MADLDLVQEALVLRPGDKLVIRVSPGISLMDMDHFRERLAARLGEDTFMLIACEQIGVIRGGDSDG